MEMQDQVTEQQETQETPQATGAETSGAESAPEKEAETSESISGESADGETQGASQPSYSPKLKFNFLEKEYDFDPIFKDVVKSEAVEKKLKELHEKSYGIDFVKKNLGDTREKYSTLEKEHNHIRSSISELRDLYKIKDFDSFFQKMDIPVADILQWVHDKLNYSQLPPDQKQVLDGKRTAERERMMLEKQLQERNQSLAQEMGQRRTQELSWELGKPGVKEAVTGFDAKHGEGSFFSEVIRLGQWTAQNKGIDLPVDEAVAQVMRFAGIQANTAGTQAGVSLAATSQPAGGTPPSAPQRKEPPVIPNVGGSGQASPARAGKVKSIADLKKKAAELSSH